MRSTRGALWALAILGGYFAWRNRFAIQRQLESMGIKTPMFKGDFSETARSIASKVGGKVEHGTDTMKQGLDQKSDQVQSGFDRKVGNY